MGHYGTSEERRELTPASSSERSSDSRTYSQVEEERVLRDVDRKLRKKSLMRAIPSLLLNVGTLYKMVRDRSFHITWATRALILGGLAYFLLPTDATPDYLPGIGFIDDTVVVGLIVKRLASEIDRYKRHISQYIGTTEYLDAAG